MNSRWLMSLAAASALLLTGAVVGNLMVLRQARQSFPSPDFSAFASSPTANDAVVAAEIPSTEGSEAARARLFDMGISPVSGTVPAADSAPERLVAPPEATRIESDAEDDSGHQARNIIREELPNASSEEREIWWEQLKHLPPHVVREILRIRQRVGGGLSHPNLLPPITDPAIESLEVPQPIALGESPEVGNVSQIDETIRELRRAQQVLLNNLANVETIGFRRARLRFEDRSNPQSPSERQGELLSSEPAALTAGRGGLRFAGSVLECTDGELLQTEAALDVAIRGDGFFGIRDGDEVRYTRNGHFTLDAEGALAVACGERICPLEPKVTIPTNAIEVTITPEGKVHVLTADGDETVSAGQIHLCLFVNPQQLRPLGEHQYAATRGSGRPQAVLPTLSGAGTLQSGCLERSNANRDREMAEFKRLQEQIDAWNEVRRLMGPAVAQ